MYTTLLLGFSTLAAVVLMARTVQTLRRHRYRAKEPLDSEYPSVSVCIAARNETHALAQCLERVLKSDYPKLEILVLDDSSTDDTSLIIKSFASAGVRFIPGAALPSGWLGKNHAYQTLINEASGDVLLFLDVDTTIRTTTISRLIDYMRAERATMLSVLPHRTDTEHVSAVFNTFRYHWELLLGTEASPPAASALWLIEAAELERDGIGLGNYGMSVRPERHLARQIRRLGTYRYVIGTSFLGVGFEKRLKSQWETATRLYYPMSGRNLVAWIGSIIFLCLLLVPLAILLGSFASPFHNVWAAGTTILVILSLLSVFKALHGPAIWRLRVLIWPLLLLQELLLLVRSFITYQTGAMTWKGRKVAAQPVNASVLSVDE